MSIYLPSMRHLQYLVALDDYKSFSRAAETCNVTQSTLSAGIKDLETLLGQSVAERTQRQVRLSPFGQDVVRQARKILKDAEVILGLAHSAKAPLSGRLRLGIIPTVAPFWLPQSMGRLTDAYPDLRLELYEDTTAALMAKLEIGEIDAAVMAFPYDTNGFKTQILFEEVFVLARLATGGSSHPVRLADLDEQALLVLEDGHCLRDHILAACRFESARTISGFRATSLATLIQMVRQGYGYTLLPRMVADSGTVPDTIELINFEGVQPTRQIGLTWRETSPMARDVAVLIEHLKNPPYL